MPDEPDHTPEVSLKDLLPAENPKNVSTLAIVNTVVSTLNEVIAALRDEIVALSDVERNNRRRITIFMTVIVIAALASVTGVWLNYSQGNDVKSIVNYISDCQKPEGQCKKDNDSVIAGVVAEISSRTFDSITCVLDTVPEARTDANIKECRGKYLGAKK